MNTTYIPNRSITLVTSDFRVLTGTKSTCDWSAVEAAVKSNDEQALINAISPKKAVEGFDKDLYFEGNNVFFKGQQLRGEDVNRIFEYLASGAPKSSMVKFLDSKTRNVSQESVSSLYSFLNNKEMPLTDNGTVLGFKGVREDLFSVHTGSEPLISGIRRDDGAICNEIGQVVWMDRQYVDCNPNNSCGPGLHIGSRNYAKSWGPRVMIVEFYPEHVGMVPNHACEVLRVNKYRVVGELNGTEFLGNTYNGNYSRPEGETPEYTPEFEDAVIQPEVVDVEFVVSPKLDGIRYNISDWSKGQSTGFLDGKAHQKRKFYECDKNAAFDNFSKEYVSGYLIGYKDGRATNS